MKEYSESKATGKSSSMLSLVTQRNFAQTDNTVLAGDCVQVSCYYRCPFFQANGRDAVETSELLRNHTIQPFSATSSFKTAKGLCVCISHQTSQSVVSVLWFERCSNFNEVMGDSERAVRKMESSLRMRNVGFSVFLTCILPRFMRNAILLDR